MGMNKPKIDLQIKSLALRGVAPSQRKQVHAAIERELERLIAEQGTPHALAWGRRLAPLPSARIAVKPGADVATIAAQVARKMYHKLSD